jgi:hypothetical protein
MFRTLQRDNIPIEAEIGGQVYHLALREFNESHLFLECLERRAPISLGKELSLRTLISNQSIMWQARVGEIREGLLAASFLALPECGTLPADLARQEPPPGIRAMLWEGGKKLDLAVYNFSPPDILFYGETALGEADPELRFEIDGRVLRCASKLLRKFTDGGMFYAAFTMTALKMEDLRFFVERVYGRSVRESDIDLFGVY